MELNVYKLQTTQTSFYVKFLQILFKKTPQSKTVNFCVFTDPKECWLSDLLHWVICNSLFGFLSWHRIAKYRRCCFLLQLKFSCVLNCFAVHCGTLRLVSRRPRLLVTQVMWWVCLWHLTPGCLSLEPAMLLPSSGTSEKECADKLSLAMSQTSMLSV